MTKIVNSWTEFQPLKRVIVGRPEGSHVFAPEPGSQLDMPSGGFPLGTWGPFPQELVDAANEQMDYFVEKLEERGVIVDRVTVPPGLLEQRPFGTPDWMVQNFRGTNCPRDLFMPIGNEIIEAPGVLRTRWFEYLCLRPLFEQYFKEDPEFLWTAAPKPRLTDESYEKNYWHKMKNIWTEAEKAQRAIDWKFVYTEKEPLWDAAAAARCGKDVFMSVGHACNKAGFDWLKRYFGSKGIRFHHILWNTIMEGPSHVWGYGGGHIDVLLLPFRPGLFIHNPQKPILNTELIELCKINDWEIVDAAAPTHVYTNTISSWGGSDKPGNSWISMNTLSLDEKTVFVEAHEERYIEQLDKLGFEVIPIPYDRAEIFGGSLHCTTVDVYREGECVDYFPKQVKGY
jgi:glycine amidinotransferase